MRNSSEDIPLISNSTSSFCDDDTISMPSTTTTPPPYTDDRSSTPRPQPQPQGSQRPWATQGPQESQGPQALQGPQLTPPTTTTDSHDPQPTLNIYTAAIDAPAILDLFERYKKTGDVAPKINLHVTKKADHDSDADADGNGEDPETACQKCKDRRPNQNAALVLKHLSVCLGILCGVFFIWVLFAGVAAVERAKHGN